MTPRASQEIENGSIKAITEGAAKAPPTDPNRPTVPFPSILSQQMTRDQERALVTECFADFERLDTEMARSQTTPAASYGTLEWYESAGAGSGRSRRSDRERDRLFTTFFGKRWVFEATYQNNLDWRRSIPKSVFQQVNLTLSTSRRITSQRIARYVRYFFETRPFWAAQPVLPHTVTKEGDDKEFARKLHKIGDMKLTESDSDAVLRRAIERAAVIGEAIIHTHRYVNDDYYDEELSVLVDITGKPIMAGDGDYITESDEWLQPSGVMQMDGGIEQSPQGPAIMVKKDNAEILKRDPGTSRHGADYTVNGQIYKAQQFELRVVKRRAVHYQGAKLSLVNSRDFLCGLTEADIHTAPVIIHLDDVSASAIAQQYAADASPTTIAAAAALLRSATTGTGRHGGTDGSGPASRQANTARKEYTNMQPPAPGRLNIGHFYKRCDPTGSGLTSDVYVMMDMTSRQPIYYNYTSACSPTRRRPYDVVRSKEVDGRWFGEGEMEQFHNVSMLIDLFLCAAARTQSWSGRVVFFRPDRTEEGQAGKKLEFEWGKTYTPKGDFTAAQILEVVTIPDNKSISLMDMMQTLLQAATNESGTATANDAQAAGMQTAETATGVMSINDAGNELTSFPVATLRTGLTKALENFILVSYRFHDYKETYTIFEGDVPQQFTLEPRELANITVNVRILLTTFETQRRQSQAAQGIQIFTQWRQLCLTDPQGAAQGRSLYVDALQANAMDNADEIIVDPAATPPALPAPPPDPSGPPSPQQPAPASTKP